MRRMLALRSADVERFMNLRSLAPLRALPALPLALILFASPAGAETLRQLPSSSSDILLSFAPIVKKAQPAVVNVYASRTDRRPQNPFFDDPIFRRFFGDGGTGRPGGPTARSLGSGVLVDSSGLVVTNYHVIQGMTDVKVALADKREYDANIVLRDQRTDLVVLQLKGGESFPAMELGDSDALEVGDFVLAIGNPFAVGQTVTQGIVSALARTKVGISDYGFFIQTDAAINPGNSGGALVDVNGRLVGINTAIFSRSGGSIGIGFAIPSNMVQVVVASARGGGSAVKRPWLGAKLQAITPEIAENLGLSRPAGALVASISSGGPAARAGLKTGDVVVSVDGQAVDDPNAFEYRFMTRPLGRTAQVGVLRGGKDTRLAIALATAPEAPLDVLVIRSRSPFTGAKVANLSPALAEELRLDTSASGVVVVDVTDGSLAQSFGFQRGDRILSVNDERIARTRDLDRASGRQNRLWRVTIERGGKELSVVFGG